MLVNQNWRFKFRIITARILILLRRLTHADYTAQELSELIPPHLPQEIPVEVPYGKGTLLLEQAEVKMPYDNKTIDVQLLGGFKVESLGNPIYRAHVVALIQAQPVYDAQQKTVRVKDVQIKDIYLVNDQYAFINDTQEIIANLVPRPMQNLLAGTMKSAMGILTAGASDTAMAYLKLYLSGSKQKVLDYHKPQLGNLLQNLTDDEDFCYELDMEDWQELLFARYGKEVVVENGVLRFKF